MSLIKVENLAAGYGLVEVLRNISLEINQGEVVAVLGSNGVGKTTLNNCLSGLIKPNHGKIFFQDEVISNKSPEEIVDMGLIRRGKSNRSSNLENVLNIFPKLSERISQTAGTLSGGEQQMVAIGRGLMGDPRLLLLDEPSLGLSPLLVEQMFDLIKKISDNGLTVLLVEQNVTQSLSIADRAYVIEEGAIAISGLSKDLLKNAELKRSYLGL